MNGKTNLAGEGHEVMFTEGEDINVANNDHFIVVLWEDRVIDDICNRRRDVYLSADDDEMRCAPGRRSSYPRVIHKSAFA